MPETPYLASENISNVPGVQVPQASPASFGGGIAQGMESLGRSIQDVAGKLQERQNQSVANQAVLDINQRMSEKLYGYTDPDTNERTPGHLETQGLAAAGHAKKFQSEQQQIINDSTSKMTPIQRSMVLGDIRRSVMNFNDMALNHEANQTRIGAYQKSMDVAQDFHNQAEQVQFDGKNINEYMAKINPLLDSEMAKRQEAVGSKLGKGDLELAKNNSMAQLITAKIRDGIADPTQAAQNFALSDALIKTDPRLNEDTRSKLAAHLEETQNRVERQQNADAIKAEKQADAGHDNLISQSLSAANKGQKVDWAQVQAQSDNLPGSPEKKKQTAEFIAGKLKIDSGEQTFAKRSDSDVAMQLMDAAVHMGPLAEIPAQEAVKNGVLSEKDYTAVLSAAKHSLSDEQKEFVAPFFKQANDLQKKKTLYYAQGGTPSEHMPDEPFQKTTLGGRLFGGVSDVEITNKDLMDFKQNALLWCRANPNSTSDDFNKWANEELYPSRKEVALMTFTQREARTRSDLLQRIQYQTEGEGREQLLAPFRQTIERAKGKPKMTTPETPEEEENLQD